ncbi:MAG: CDP-alcohol phosphatidyltransferase family protein [Candidatus Binatia bacterium]
MISTALIVIPSTTPLSPLTHLGGLSLVKRAVLTAQKAGAQTCYLYGENQQDRIHRELSGDPRILCRIVWLPNENTSAEIVDNHPTVLVFAVDTIFRHSLVQAVFTKVSTQEISVLVDDNGIATLALAPGTALASLVGELQGGKALHETTVFTQGKKVFPPRGPGAFLSTITTEAQIPSVERGLLLSLENPRDGKVDTIFNRKLSRWLTRGLLRTPLTPNQVTILSALVGIAGALCFLPGGYWGPVFGALLLQFSVVLDCCDGEIARVKFLESPLGDWLDIVCDTIVTIAIFLGIGVAVWNDGASQHALVLGGVLALGGLLSFPFVTLAEKTEDIGDQRNGWEDVTIKKLLTSLTTRDSSIVVVASAISGKLTWFLWGAAIGAHVFWLSLAWLLFRTGRLARLRSVHE